MPDGCINTPSPSLARQKCRASQTNQHLCEVFGEIRMREEIATQARLFVRYSFRVAFYAIRFNVIAEVKISVPLSFSFYRSSGPNSQMKPLHTRANPEMFRDPVVIQVCTDAAPTDGKRSGRFCNP
jgi:hypothetical protein